MNKGKNQTTGGLRLGKLILRKNESTKKLPPGNLLWILVFCVLLAGCSAGGADLRAKYDVCFKRDNPGASDRVVAFTPVRCTDKTVVLGEAIEGEFASLGFEDADGDGVSEIIVSSEFWCRWGFEPCLDPRRTTVKVSGERDSPKFTIVRVEELQPAPEFKR